LKIFTSLIGNKVKGRIKNIDIKDDITIMAGPQASILDKNFNIFLILDIKLQFLIIIPTRSSAIHI
jgi:hypothetical protein